MYVNLYYKATTIFKFENASQMLCVGGLVFKEEIVECGSLFDEGEYVWKRG